MHGKTEEAICLQLVGLLALANVSNKAELTASIAVLK